MEIVIFTEHHFRCFFQVGCPEDFAMKLCKHFLFMYRHVVSARVRVETVNGWRRIIRVSTSLEHSHGERLHCFRYGRQVGRPNLNWLSQYEEKFFPYTSWSKRMLWVSPHIWGDITTALPGWAFCCTFYGKLSLVSSQRHKIQWILSRIRFPIPLLCNSSLIARLTVFAKMMIVYYHLWHWSDKSFITIHWWNFNPATWAAVWPDFPVSRLCIACTYHNYFLQIMISWLV